MNSAKRGFVIVVSGPSGVGKGTIIKEVVRRGLGIHLAVSATTRPPRPGEVDGRDYFFLSADEFDRREKAGAFLESCQVHSNRYGTLKSEVVPYVEAGQDVMVEIDIQGAQKIRQTLDRLLCIFVAPPRFEDLVSRLKGRATDSEETIQKRLLVAGRELEEIGKYNYIVVNSDVDQAVEDVLDIVRRSKHDMIG
jgi:guanylate kinase